MNFIQKSAKYNEMCDVGLKLSARSEGCECGVSGSRLSWSSSEGAAISAPISGGVGR